MYFVLTTGALSEIAVRAQVYNRWINSRRSAIEYHGAHWKHRGRQENAVRTPYHHRNIANSWNGFFPCDITAEDFLYINTVRPITAYIDTRLVRQTYQETVGRDTVLFLFWVGNERGVSSLRRSDFFQTYVFNGAVSLI